MKDFLQDNFDQFISEIITQTMSLYSRIWCLCTCVVLRRIMMMRTSTTCARTTRKVDKAKKMICTLYGGGPWYDSLYPQIFAKSFRR